MNRGNYRTGYRRSSRSKRWYLLAAILVVGAAGWLAAYKFVLPTPVERAVGKLQFDASVNASEKGVVMDAIKRQSKTYDGSVTVRTETVLEARDRAAIFEAYVPVTHIYATRQALSKAELAGKTVYVPTKTDSKTRSAIAGALGLQAQNVRQLTTAPQELPDTAVAFVPVKELTPEVKLLTFEGAYYLDTFTKGAVFRQAAYSGRGAADLANLQLNDFATKDTTLKVNMTGVTALTRVMMNKLRSVKDPKYFSKQIGAFLADADITHVSNEVSFKTGCTYNAALFCAPPEMIDVLKDSGVDVVELTGNHNNDVGNQYNTESINLYHSLGWRTVGGGLNDVEAAKPYIADQKQSKIAILAYNYADALGSGAIAKATTAGANPFDFEKIKADIATVKQQAGFVIVDVQFWECYAYPGGYIEYPQCDGPIPNQKEVFRKLADLGADMVVGISAHQPQTYEQYNGVPIYYGLGNLYFEQTQWPGTERGIILTHYFVHGKLVQTKLSPTRYDGNLQTHLMSDADAVWLLDRLKTAREAAGL